MVNFVSNYISNLKINKKKKKIRFKGIFLNLKIKRQMLAIKLIKYRQGKSML